jgi:hypothetical protein
LDARNNFRFDHTLIAQPFHPVDRRRKGAGKDPLYRIPLQKPRLLINVLPSGMIFLIHLNCHKIAARIQMLPATRIAFHAAGCLLPASALDVGDPGAGISQVAAIPDFHRPATPALHSSA